LHLVRMSRLRSGQRNLELLTPEGIDKELAKVNTTLSDNKIILVTILNPIYNIDVDTIYKVCRASGDVHKIVIFERGHVVHALVEFKDIKTAKEAKSSLHGCNIYSDGCTLKVEFARQEQLNVQRNDDKTWDFTKAEHAVSKVDKNTGRKVLLDETPKDRLVDDVKPVEKTSENFDPRSPVMMVYNLHPENFNCQRLFNLFCLYGNIVRINFIRNKEGCAMVEFEHPDAAEEAAYNLHGMEVFGNRLSFEESRKHYVEEIRNPYELPDGEKSFENFIGDKNNRFSTPKQAAKNRKCPPTKTLHFYNVPKMEDDSLMDVFSDLHAPFPTSMTWFESRSEKSFTGLVEFDSCEDACEALVIANNTEVENEDSNDKRPYIMKLCFAKSY